MGFGVLDRLEEDLDLGFEDFNGVWYRILRGDFLEDCLRWTCQYLLS